MPAHINFNTLKKLPAANASTQKQQVSKQQLGANAGIQKRSQRNKTKHAGGQRSHTEAAQKKQRTPAAIASTQQRSKRKKNAPGQCYHTEALKKKTEPRVLKAAVSNSARVGNGPPGRGQLCFQLAPSWKRKRFSAKLPFPTRGALETQAFLGKAAVSNPRRVGNERPGHGRLCFQLNSSWKRKRFSAKLPFPTRFELETGSPGKTALFSNSF
jgi:hypothetical protein